jgi:hypothetical protein
MANKADDGVPSEVVGEKAETPKPQYEYSISVSFRCMSDACKGKAIGLTGNNLVMAALRNSRIEVNCPVCGESALLVASKDEKSKILQAGVIPMNREMRRKEKHMAALSKIVGPR